MLDILITAGISLLKTYMIYLTGNPLLGIIATIAVAALIIAIVEVEL